VLAGTAAARLALGDDLLDALRRGIDAAARSLGGPGGTGWLPAAA
jgi:2-dehydro-3-deoxygluconokinase